MKYIDMRKISGGEARQIRRQVVRLKEMGRIGSAKYGLRIKGMAK